MSTRGWPVRDRLLRLRHVTPSGCWEWIGHRGPEGYGTIAINGATRSVHRVAFEVFAGRAIPNELQIDHLCRNTGCFNPAHLEAVTARTNTLRAFNSPSFRNAKKDRCDQGHPFDDANTYTHRGHRLCRACRREAVRAYKIRRAAALIEAAKENAETRQAVSAS